MAGGGVYPTQQNTSGQHVTPVIWPTPAGSDPMVLKYSDSRAVCTLFLASTADKKTSNILDYEPRVRSAHLAYGLSVYLPWRVAKNGKKN